MARRTMTRLMLLCPPPNPVCFLCACVRVCVCHLEWACACVISVFWSLSATMHVAAAGQGLTVFTS